MVAALSAPGTARAASDIDFANNILFPVPFPGRDIILVLVLTM